MAPNATTNALISAIAGQTHLPVTQLFRKGEIVGKGAYGAVHRGIHIGTNSVVALKIINLDTEDDDVEAIQKEVALLSQLREGTNVTQYYGCWLDGARVWIVMDFASGGSVRTLMKASATGTLEEKYTVVITREVLVALSFIHRVGVIHRDIKAANVLVTSEGRVILCDFGVSALLPTAHSKRATFVGTPYWMAPEVISGTLYDTKADIWGLGITIYEMMMKTPPHASEAPMRALVLITNGKPPRLPESVGSKDMKDFMASCLKEVPNERSSPDELSKSKWIKSASKTSPSMLKELLARYAGWVNQGGVRESLAGDVPWEDQINDDEYVDIQSSRWEFDTVRGRSDSDSATYSNNVSYTMDSPDTSFASSTSSNKQPPRSLRMLFEDSSVPPPLPDSFLRNNLGSSRDRSQTSTPIPVVAASAPAHSSFLSPEIVFGQQNTDRTERRREALDDLHTARQTNFAFPRLAAPIPNASEETGFRRLDSPAGSRAASPTDNTSLSDDKVTYIHQEVRNNKNLANIMTSSVPVPTTAFSSITNAESPPAGPPQTFTKSSDTQSRPSAATSERNTEDNSTKTPDRRTARKGNAPMNFQFPPPVSSSSSIPTSSARPRTPSGKELSSALSLPKPLPHHHPASRSLDSQTKNRSQRPTTPTSKLGNGEAGTTVPAPPPLLRAQTATHIGSREEEVGNVSLAEVSGRLMPSKPAIRKQVSMEAMNNGGGGLAVPVIKGIGLKDVLQLSPASSNLTAALGLGDLLPPSPSTQSPHIRGFMNGPIHGHGPLGEGPDSAASSFSVSHMDYSMVSSTMVPSSSQSSATSAFLTSMSASGSAASSVSLAGGPPIRPLDYSVLLNADDVHSELVRSVDDLAVWLSVVENGLTGLLEGVSADMANGRGVGEGEFIEEEEEGGFDSEADYPMAGGDTSGGEMGWRSDPLGLR